MIAILFLDTHGKTFLFCLQQSQFKSEPPNEDGGVRTSRVSVVNSPGPGFGGSFVKMNRDCREEKVKSEI